KAYMALRRLIMRKQHNQGEYNTSTVVKTPLRPPPGMAHWPEPEPRREKHWPVYVGIIFASLICGALFRDIGVQWFAKAPEEKTKPLYAVVNEKADLRYGPGEDYEVYRTVSKNHVMRLKDDDGWDSEWFFVEIVSLSFYQLSETPNPEERAAG